MVTIPALIVLFTVLGPVAAGPVNLSQTSGGERVIVAFNPDDPNAWSAVHRHPVGLERGPWAGNFYDARCFPNEVTTHGTKFVFEKSGGLVYGLKVEPGDSITLPEPASVVSVAYAAVCWWENGQPFKRVTLIVEDSHGRQATTSLTLADWCARAFSPHAPDHNFLVCEFDHRLSVEERKIRFFIIPIGITWKWRVAGLKCGVWAFRLSASELGLRDITRIEFRYGDGHLYILAVTITPTGPFDDIVGGPNCSGTTVGPDGMDEVGSCYWEGEWPARFGHTTVTANGVPFLIPPASGPNALLANGRLVELPRPARTVWFLYAATNWWFGDKPYGPVDLVVVDDRGRTVTARVLLVDWCAHDVVPNNIEVLAFNHRAIPGGLQSIHCGVWAFELDAGQLGLPNIKAVYFPSMGRRKVWILGATLDGQPVGLGELRPHRISHPWSGFKRGVVYPGGETLDGTFLLPSECRKVQRTPIEGLADGNAERPLELEDRGRERHLRTRG
ncbi:Uncharacterized secreted protein specific for M.kandleri, contains repeats, MK-5 family [Methanopyrus kandleri AV19]|uniref:Uncharacterized secreted protein specific for M.kandleri, contains repeats, MK-5 family n=1 Tax=Methanopyrus kandleri (strain AV19 / DSM 6324 / JCM 9639 / NBRC 100938) TaxID=190192 RepID=Q8TWT5_METKA|nr:Uncharacterized secreted protein specific for M.kandleri, contains repeats, MK-5 family [Methanopyrus kandleri AV19]